MSTPIRILQVLGGLEAGGAETFVMNLYRTTNREKVQFDFVKHVESNGIFEDEITKLGGRIYRCPKYNGKNYFAYCKWWNDFFKEHPEYHVIHGHVRSTASIYLKIAKKYGLITIAHSHNTSNGKGLSGVGKDMMQLPIRYIADYLFACSDKAGIWLYGEKATMQSNYRMIPNGVNLERFAFDEAKRTKMRKQLGINEYEFVIGHIGRFTEQKNHKYLLEIFSIYHKKDPASKLLMLGDGELREAIETQCRDLNIFDSVKMLGVHSNIENYYQVMDVFVFPSLWEGLPVTLVEAQANGLPCLVSDVITQNVALTGLIQYIPLGETKKWEQSILESKSIGRGVLSEDDQKGLNAFDIREVSRKIQKFYIEQDFNVLNGVS